MTEIQCPNCGAGRKLASPHVRLVDCKYCGVSIVVDKDALRLAGKRGDMFKAPGLIALHRAFRVDHTTYRPIGHVRFSYGRGWWDEYWCLIGHDDGVWVSVDEGDVAIQRRLADDEAPVFKALNTGDSYSFRGQSFTVMECEEASCLAVRGELPEVIEVGETHRFANLMNAEGAIMSLESWEGGHVWSYGHWVDPFDVRRA